MEDPAVPGFFFVFFFLFCFFLVNLIYIYQVLYYCIFIYIYIYLYLFYFSDPLDDECATIREGERDRLMRLSPSTKETTESDDKWLQGEGRKNAKNPNNDNNSSSSSLSTSSGCVYSFSFMLSLSKKYKDLPEQGLQLNKISMERRLYRCVAQHVKFILSQ
jgi:hypothetical protein